MRELVRGLARPMMRLLGRDERGAIGVLVAVLVDFIVANTTSVPVAVPMAWVAGSVLAATTVGLFFGVYPAHRASKLDPIEALRFEA